MAGAEPHGQGTDKQKASPERLAFLVDYYDKLSNLLEDLRKLGRFAQLLPAAEVIILNC